MPMTLKPGFWEELAAGIAIAVILIILAIGF